MTWKQFSISPDGSHHVLNGVAAYSARFDEVLSFHPPGLAAVRRGAEGWHITPDGSPAYADRFQRTFGFYDEHAAVMAEDGWHHIDAGGAPVYPERYAWCGNFQEGLCSVRDSEASYLHIDRDGMPVYSARWRYAGDFRGGIAVVQAEDSRSTHIDRQGHPVHGRWFLDLDVFHKGFARAQDDGGWTHVLPDGTPAYGRRFAMVEPFYNGQARVEDFDGALEIIDEDGKTRVRLRPPRRSAFAALSADLVGFWRTQAIATAVRLGVFEALPGTEETVAEQCGLQPDGSLRLLRALGELNLVTREGAQWNFSPRGEFLRADHPLTLADAALEYAGPLGNLWEALPRALLAGGDWCAPDVFGQVAAHGARQQAHHRMLRSYALHDYPQVVAAFGLRGDERIIDAGGGIGVLAHMVLDMHSASQVTVLDRPEVVEQGRRESGSPANLGWRACDIFSLWGIDADAVILARVLHDWDDADAVCILRRARVALPTGGRLYVVEMTVPEGGVAGALCDLHLLAVCGGRERTAPEFKRLFQEGGFDLVEVRSVAALPSVLVGVAQ